MSAPEAGPPSDGSISHKASISYWQNTAADVDGMLGGVPSAAGFSFVSKVDLQSSRSFLAKLGIGKKVGRRTVASALEGGAGIGRVTEGLLLELAESVDIIEPVAKFTDVLRGKPGVRNIFNVGLEDWQPAKGVRYDLIWTQWCVNYLTDEQLVAYLQRCREALSPELGIIVLKENLSTAEGDMFDEIDSSVTRKDEKFLALIERAGLRIIRTELQKGIPTKSPRKLLPVKSYALKPKNGLSTITKEPI